MQKSDSKVRLTQYSHGAGCGCKISPVILDEILANNPFSNTSEQLLVGNDLRDDAAVYDLGNGDAVISTTDFFMPIVDDAFDFGRIAATNAISDIYAMGGKPIMAIAILGWPVSKLPPAVAREVINGARQVCQNAGIILAGGHSIDSPEPIFGLAVTGQMKVSQLKRNSSAMPGDRLYLTKPLGIGILTTAEKKQLLKTEHRNLARDTMCKLNSVGADVSALEGVTAMTDVTGFGLLGHLSEMCEGSELSATLQMQKVPFLEGVENYLNEGAIPGGTERNFQSYGTKIAPLSEIHRNLLCDPQTSGGLLIAVNQDKCEALEALLTANDIDIHCIGGFETSIKSETKDSDYLVFVDH